MTIPDKLKYYDSQKWESLISNANLFYNGKKPEIPDYEYDSILNEVKLLDPEFSIFNYIKYDSDFERRPHTVKLPNFEKVNFDRLGPEYHPESVVYTCKYDGSSIVAYYIDGELQNILTRSNEETGIVQTQKLYKKVPHKVDKRVRAILLEATVEGNRSLSNGLTNSKYKQDEVDEKLFLNPFDCILWEGRLGYVARMNLTGLKYDTLDLSQIMSLKNQGDEPVIELEREGRIRKVPVDGIVAYGRLDPDYGRIYKFYSTENKKSTVTKLHFVPSEKTGLISIVVEFNPVKIGSITVKRCGNAGTWDTIKKKKLGVGSEVEVFLTKVTIPQIANNTPWTEEPELICPECGQPLHEFQGKLICKNPTCLTWLERYSRVGGDMIKFLEPPRAKGDWIHNMSQLQKEYCKELQIIYEHIKNHSESC